MKNHRAIGEAAMRGTLLAFTLTLASAQTSAAAEKIFNCESYNQILVKADAQIRSTHLSILRDVNKLDNEDYVDGHESVWSAKKRVEIAATAVELQRLLRALRPDRPVFPNEISGYLLGRSRGCAKGPWIVFYDKAETYIDTIFQEVGRYAAGQI